MTRNAGSLARTIAVSAALAGSLVLAGCSGAAGGDDTAKAGATFDPKEKVTLEASWWGDDTRAALFHKVIQQFEAKYPNVTVKETPVGSPDDLFNRLATDFGGGGETAPDLFALGGAKPQEYGSAGALLDLGTVKNIVQSDKYPDFSLTSAQVDGKLYSLPTGGNATAAFINTDIFKRAGVPVPDSSWSWDDLISAADKIGSMGLTNAQGKPIYGLDLRVADILGTYAAQKTKYGVYDPKGKLDIGADGIADWYKIEKKLADGKGLPDPSVITAGQALPPDQQLYTLGQAAITFGYSNLVGSYSAGGATQILPPPSDSKKNGVALLPSAFWAINAQTKHPAAAAELMNWFLNEPESAKLILDTRGVPFNPEQAKVVTPLLQGPNKVAAEYVAQTLKSGTVAPPQPNGGANFNKYAQDAEAEVLFGKQTPQQAAEDFISKLSTDLKQNQG
jgi:multiple sugar transport system substrate-binding protein